MTADRSDVLFPDRDRHDVVVCGQPDCTASLYLERTTSYGISAADTVGDLAAGEHTSSWSVECSAGHVVLLPLDTGESATFGTCTVHDDDEPHDASCDDMARLRRVGS